MGKLLDLHWIAGTGLDEERSWSHTTVTVKTWSVSDKTVKKYINGQAPNELKPSVLFKTFRLSKEFARSGTDDPATIQIMRDELSAAFADADIHDAPLDNEEGESARLPFPVKLPAALTERTQRVRGAIASLLGAHPTTGDSGHMRDLRWRWPLELPNALLEAFSNNGFLVPVTGHTVLCPPERRPLLIVTTNEERELPNAFLRRVLVLWIALPDDDDALVDELIAIGTEHQEWLLDARHGNNRRRGACKVIREAAQAVSRSRYELRDGSYQPGTSEFLDLVAALAQLAPDDEPRQREMLETLKDFVLHKSPEPPG